jgi:carboxypeptidase C (cathepsin A)
LGGESFAGVWVPEMARVVKVDGIILGNPWIDPLNQYPSVLEYAKLHGLLTGEFLKRAERDLERCR